jgi:hypothetical protein
LYEHRCDLTSLFHCLRILPSRYTVFRVIGQSNQKLGVFLLVFLLGAGLLSGSATGQGMYKCKDAAGRITYSGKECGLIGQTDAGEITGRAIDAPIVKTPVPARTPAAAPPKATAAASKSAAKAPAPAAEPERRCFKTAKGMRCNDKPEDEPAGK